jgi:hypothetical protein
MCAWLTMLKSERTRKLSGTTTIKGAQKGNAHHDMLRPVHTERRHRFLGFDDMPCPGPELHKHGGLWRHGNLLGGILIFSRALREFRICNRGMCQAPAGGGSSTAGSGTALGGEGAACGRITFGGGVTKNIPCRHGLQCHFGHCERPAQ